jgi:hypothetical protein
MSNTDPSYCGRVADKMLSHGAAGATAKRHVALKMTDGEDER